MFITNKAEQADVPQVHFTPRPAITTTTSSTTTSTATTIIKIHRYYYQYLSYYTCVLYPGWVLGTAVPNVSCTLYPCVLYPKSIPSVSCTVDGRVDEGEGLEGGGALKTTRLCTMWDTDYMCCWVQDIYWVRVLGIRHTVYRCWVQDTFGTQPRYKTCIQVLPLRGGGGGGG